MKRQSRACTSAQMHKCTHPLTHRTFNARPVQVTHYQFKPCQHFNISQRHPLSSPNSPSSSEQVNHQQDIQYCAHIYRLDSPPNNCNPTRRMSSFDNDPQRETAEASAEQTEVDGDAGSEIDTSIAPTPETVNKDVPEGPHHARSNSVKKPITFKAVSVTKSFLAKAGSVTTPANKGNGDKSWLSSMFFGELQADSSSPVHYGKFRKYSFSSTSTSTRRQNCKRPANINTQINEFSSEERNWSWTRSKPGVEPEQT